MADGVDERLTALEQEVQRLKARLDVSERDRQSDLAELHSDIARLRAEMAGGLSDVKKVALMGREMDHGAPLDACHVVVWGVGHQMPLAARR